MGRLERAAHRHPLATAFGMVVAAMAVMAVGVGVASVGLGWDLDDPRTQLVGQTVGCVAVLLVLWRSGWLRPAGVTQVGTRSVWLATVLVLLYTGAVGLYALVGTLAVDLSIAAESVPTLLHTTLAGVMEELLFRGLVLHVLVVGWRERPWRDPVAIVVSAALFGVLHLLNLAGSTLDVTMLQVTEAFLSAVLYGALVVVGGSVWPAVVLHSLVNLLVTTAAENIPGFAVAAGDLLLLVLLDLPLVALAVLLLGRRRRLGRTAVPPAAWAGGTSPVRRSRVRR